LMEHSHTTPFEMCEFKFRVKAPLFVRSQWMRHRTWSYNEVSRRYTSEDIDFYLPNDWRIQDTKNKQSSLVNSSQEKRDKIESDVRTAYICFSGGGQCPDDGVSSVLEHFNDIGLAIYNTLVDNNIAREQARFFLPPNMYTTFIAKVDAHNLMHFLKLRMSDHAQYEIRVYAETIYNEIFKQCLPWTAEAFEKFRLGK